MNIQLTIAVVVEAQDVTVELSELGELVNDDKADEVINEFLILRGIESVNDYSEWLSLAGLWGMNMQKGIKSIEYPLINGDNQVTETAEIKKLVKQYQTDSLEEIEYSVVKYVYE